MSSLAKMITVTEIVKAKKMTEPAGLFKLAETVKLIKIVKAKKMMKTSYCIQTN